MTAYTPGRVYMLAGEPVLLLCVANGPKGSPRNALVMRPNGTKIVRPFRGLRRLRLREAVQT